MSGDTLQKINGINMKVTSSTKVPYVSIKYHLQPFF